MLTPIRAALALVLALLGVMSAPMFAQSVSAKEGNIYFRSVSGRTLQITSSGLDSDPSLSADKRLVVFVRRTPALRIDTGIGETDENELWVGDTSGKPEPRRVLVGHAGRFKVDQNLVLAGFS